MTARIIFVVFVPFVVSSFVSAAAAQGRPPQQPRRPSPPKMDLSIGVGFIGSTGLGGTDADLRGPTGGPFQLFATSSRIGTSIPVEVRLDFLTGPRYVFELRGVWSRPELQTDVSEDIEGAPPLTLVESVDQYSLDIGLLVNLRPPRARTMIPFVAGGAGYVAAVHEGLTLLESGMTFRGGGGFKYPLAIRNTGRIKGTGVRVDGGLLGMTSGLATGSGTAFQVAASGSFYFMF